MKTMTKVLVLAALTLGCISSSFAVEPAYYGPMGNAEEPALRPYKWLWRGVKALAYRPAKGLKEGNLKTPVLGSVELIKGVRQGVVEFDESVYRGLTGAIPPNRGDHKRLSSVNAYIEMEPLLNALADGGPQLLLERYPLVSDDEREKTEAKARDDVKGTRECQKSGEAPEDVSAVSARQYLNNGAPAKFDEKYTGNMLKSLR